MSKKKIMAEGGYLPLEDLDPTELNEPKDDDDDADDDDNMEMNTITSTTYENPGYDEDGDKETSFGGINENDPLFEKIKEKKEAEDDIKIVYPKSKFQHFITFLHDIGEGIKLPAIKLPGRTNAATYVLRGSEFRNLKTGAKLPDGRLKNALGSRAEDIIEDMNNEIDKKKETLDKKIEKKKFLENNPIRTSEENTELENLNTEIPNEQNDISNMESERDRIQERIQERMSLRERIKTIFKKYGFTVFAVVSAVGLVIGVIVSNLSKGLSTLGKGVGNGLKTLGKKLGEILPGMVGAIVSFLFKTAGEVVGFLGKNGWLLIMVVVLYFVEQFKKKRK